jgi:hypothetical protein
MTKMKANDGSWKLQHACGKILTQMSTYHSCTSMWPLDLEYSLAKWVNHGNDLMTPYTTSFYLARVFSMLLKKQLTSFLCHIWPKSGVKIFMWWLNMAHPNHVKHNTTSSSSVIMFALGQGELRPINTPPWMDGARIWHFFPLGSCFELITSRVKVPKVYQRF